MAERQAEGFAQKWRGKVRAAWGDLTDDDVDRAEGNLDRLVGIIKEKTGEAEQAIRDRIDSMKDESDR